MTATTKTATPPTAPSVEQATGGILAAFRDAKDRENAAAAEARALRKLVDQVNIGTYDGWALSQSQSSDIVDTEAVKELLAGLGKDVPMKQTVPGPVVTYVGGK